MSNPSNASLTLLLDRHSDEACYQQIVRQLRHLIESKRLAANSRLPSSRELANQLGVSRSTTLKSYDILIAEGVLVSQAKRGIFVAQYLPHLPLMASPARVKAPLARVTTTAFTPPRPLSFDSGADVRVFPNRAWAKALRHSGLHPDMDLMLGHYSTGVPQLKQAIVEYVSSLRGLTCEAEQIIITAGNRDALSILSHALLGTTTPGRPADGRIWLENPCFRPMATLFQWLGTTPSALVLDEQGACIPAKLTTATTSSVVLLTPNRQYPLGIMMSPQRRQAWLATLEQQRQTPHAPPLWIIEDDYDNEFLYQGRGSVPLMSQDKSHSIFYVGSFSKVMFRGLRLGFIVAPKEQVANLKQSQQAIGSAASLSIQPALAEFMRNGDFGVHLRRMRRLYLTKRDALNALLQTHLTHWLQWELPHGGMHIMVYFQPRWIQKYQVLKIQAHMANSPACLDEFVVQLAAADALQLMSLSACYFDNHHGNNTASGTSTLVSEGFILGFSQSSLDELQTGVLQLQRLLQQLFPSAVGD